MALAAASVFEVQTGGNDTNGGGFVTGAAGTDYSLVAAKRTATGADDSTTDAVAVGTGVITSATAVFGTTIVGNIIYLQGGTGTLAAGWYQVLSRASVTSITVDRNVAAGTGITMNIGGALATPGMAGGVGLVAGNTIYIKAGTYTIASASTNIATGCLAPSVTVYIEGYQTTRGDLGTAPLLQASGISTFTIITTTNASTPNGIVNVSVDGASLTSSRGFSLVSGNYYLLSAINCTNSGFSLNSVVISRSIATGCSTQAAYVFATNASVLSSCVAHTNTATGFLGSVARCSYIRCLAYGNTGASSDGFSIEDVSGVINCVSYGNGRDGFRTTDDQVQFINCIAEGNGVTAGFGFVNTFGTVYLINCAGFNNQGGDTSLGTAIGVRNIGFVTGSATFFTNAAGANFSLNTTAGGGAAARAAGYPGVLASGGTGFLDIGVLQHADPAGTSGVQGSRIFSGY